MKKYIRLVSVFLLIMLLCLSACGVKPRKEGENTIEEPWKDFDGFYAENQNVDYSFFPDFKRFEKLYVIDYDFKGQVNYYNNLTKHNQIATLSALQGFALKKGSPNGLYLNVLNEAGFEQQSNSLWLTDLTKNYNLPIQRVSGDNQFNDVVNLLKTYVNKTQSGKYGYIAYEQKLTDGLNPENNPIKVGNQSVNAAFTAASATGFLPIDKSLADTFNALGFEQAYDVIGWTEEKAYNEFASRLNDKLINLTPNLNVQNRDYSIATGQLFIDEAYKSSSFRKKMQEKYPVNSGAVLMGWASMNEVEQVKYNGQNGLGFLCTVYNYNLSVTASLGKKNFLQRNQDKKIQANPDKHYIALIMSDGDNVTWHANSFNANENYLAYSYNKEVRSENDFKMGWTTTLPMADLSPNMVRYEYSKASPYDYFVASPGGSNIMYPSSFPKNDKTALKNFVAATDKYMKRMDVSYTEILNDNAVGASLPMPFDDTVMQEYAKAESLKGAFVLANYDRYVQGGELRWYNDKPFLGIGEAFWDDTPGKVAHRINNLSPDNDSVNGYTAIKIHCWSTSMKDVANMVSKLGDHIEIVSPGELMQLIDENVPHENEVRTYKPNTDYPLDVDEYLDFKKMSEQAELNGNYTIAFDNYLDYKGLYKYIGNREYDMVSFSGEPTKYNPAGDVRQSADGGNGYSVRFDGSDYNIADEISNSGLYGKFQFAADVQKIKLKVKFKSAYEPYSALFRVRVAYYDNIKRKYVSNNLITGIENNNSSFTEVKGKWTEYSFNLSKYKGKTVLLIFEYNPSATNGPMYMDEINIMY